MANNTFPVRGHGPHISAQLVNTCEQNKTTRRRCGLSVFKRKRLTIKNVSRDCLVVARLRETNLCATRPRPPFTHSVALSLFPLTQQCYKLLSARALPLANYQSFVFFVCAFKGLQSCSVSTFVASTSFLSFRFNSCCCICVCLWQC